MILHVFHVLIAIHIAFGAVGLVSFWVPVVGRKGSAAHKTWGKVFYRCILVAGIVALCLSCLTLYDPRATHPHLGHLSTDFVRGIFGVMMFYLAILTLNLVWYGRATIVHKGDHRRLRQGINLWLQPALGLAALACAIEGILIGQLLMVGMSIIGFATVGTNLAYMCAKAPAPKDYLKEHVKAIVGAGISVYTAFFAFGAVRIMPAIALHPALWAIPLIVGLTLILVHRHRISHPARAHSRAASKL